jgi:hypothetical protein
VHQGWNHESYESEGHDPAVQSISRVVAGILPEVKPVAAHGDDVGVGRGRRGTRGIEDQDVELWLCPPTSLYCRLAFHLCDNVPQHVGTNVKGGICRQAAQYGQHPVGCALLPANRSQ